MDKKVIFVISTPRLNFHTSSCLITRPFTIQDKKVNDLCAMSQKDYLSDAQLYLDSVREVLRGLPSLLCDGGYCHAMKDGVTLYRDDIHLSTAGSRYVGPFFKDLVNISQY